MKEKKPAKKAKAICALLSAAVLAVALAGCGSDKANENPSRPAASMKSDDMMSPSPSMKSDDMKSPSPSMKSK